MNIRDILEHITENRAMFVLLVGLLTSGILIALVIATEKKKERQNRADSITGSTSQGISKSRLVSIIIILLAMPILAYFAQKITENKSEDKSETAQLATQESEAALQENPEVQKYQQALQEARDSGDRTAESVALRKLGNTYEYQEDPTTARDYYLQSAELAHQIGDKKNEAYAIGSVGNQYNRAKNFSKGRVQNQRALDIFQEIGDTEGIIWSLGNLGLNHREAGETDKAEEHYQKALELSRKIGSKKEEASLLGSLGKLYFDQDKYAKARPYLEQSIALYEEQESFMAGILERYIMAIDEFKENENKQEQPDQ